MHSKSKSIGGIVRHLEQGIVGILQVGVVDFHQQMTFGVVAATVSYYVDKELVEVVHVSQCLCLVGFTTAPRSPNLIVSDFIHWLEQ